MIQRVQTVWMALTVALVCLVIFIPPLSFSLDGGYFDLMTWGIKSASTPDSGVLLVYGGQEAVSGVVTSPLSISTVTVLAMAALLPLVVIFLFKNRTLQARLLGAEFALLVGGSALLCWYVFSTSNNVGEAALMNLSTERVSLSLFPLLLLVAMVTNWFAIRGVLRDEIMVRAADRIR